MRPPAALLLMWLSACQASADGQAPAPLPARPVLSTVIARPPAERTELVGRIEPRYATQLGFRVPGRIVRRWVSVGDHVAQGDRIAAIAPDTLQLALQAAEANLKAAQARAESARSSWDRSQKLHEGRALPQAALDAARSALDASNAAVAEASARLAKAREDASYAVLRAELSGVLTRVDVEVGQVVAPNIPVAELARTDELDVLVDAPESLAQRASVGAPFEVHALSSPALSAHGEVRQVEPVADRATRTRRVWIALAAPPAALRLGTLVSARLEPAAMGGERYRVPGEALLEHAGQSSVWVVDGDHVTERTVVVAERTLGEVTLSAGVSPGERVVVAGVHSLRAGQKVRIADEGPQ